MGPEGGIPFARISVISYHPIYALETVLIIYPKMVFDVFLFLDRLFRRNKLLLFLRQFGSEHLYMLLRHIFDNDLSNQPNYKNTIFIHHTR